LALLGIPQPVRKLEADASAKKGISWPASTRSRSRRFWTPLDDLLGALPKAKPRARVTMSEAAACRHA